MNLPDDPGGRSGVFPRIDLFAPQPAEADAPAPRQRFTSPDAGILTGETPIAAEGEDLTSDESEAGPEADAP